MGRKNDAENILIIRFSALGDVAMSIPVVYSVCETNPACRFVIITRPGAALLFINSPANLTVHSVDTSTVRGVSGLWQLWQDLRKKYDITAVADLHGVLRSCVIDTFAFLSGIKVRRIHKGRYGKHRLTRRHNKVMLPLVSNRARYREVFYRLGLPREDCFENIYPQGGAPSDIFAAASPPKQPGEVWIAIAPFAKHQGKIYPLDLMRQVVTALDARPGYKIFIFGAGDQERKQIKALSARCTNVVDMASLSLGIPVEMALLSHCDAMISMDSANMHIASLVLLPVVSIWGATHPYCGFMGWRQKRGDAVQLQMACRPCSVFGDKPCMRADYHCMRGIPPQYVLERLDRVLRRARYRCSE